MLLLTVQNARERNKIISSRNGNREVQNESFSSDETAHDLQSDGN